MNFTQSPQRKAERKQFKYYLFRDQMTFSSGLKSVIRPQFWIAVTYAAMLFLSWHRWTSLIVDIGRETDLPFRILSGEMLYRDVHYIYPPFSPYFNALLYRVFGEHLDTLIFSGFFFSILVTFLCYKILRKLMPEAEASIATAFVVVLCVFKPAGNLILPYSFAALHAAVFSLAAVLFTLRYAEYKNKRDLIVAGVFTGLAAITKQEFAFACAGMVSLYLVYLHRTNFTKLLTDLAYAVIPAMLVAVPVFGLLFINIDARTLIDDCHLFYTNIPESLIFYNRYRSGLNYPLSSFMQMIGAAAVSVAFTVLIIFFSDRTGKLRQKLVVLFVISSAIVAVVLFFFIDDWDGSPLRALPFFLLGIILLEWRRKAKDKFNAGFPFIVAVYSFAILIRVIFRVPSGGFSGSFYLPTSLFLIFCALLLELPRTVKKWTGDESSFLRARQITLTLCIVTVITMMGVFGFRYRTKYTYEIAAARGTVVVERESGPVLDAALKFIEANTAPGEVIAVVPEGNDLAFLSGRRINLRHQVLIPGFLGQQDELDAIAALKNSNVRYIFIPNRAMREFGSVAFGQDFYQTLGNWIEENFQVVEVFGISEGQIAEVGKPPYFIKVYKKKESL